jgi:hypothetical protein
MELKVEENFAAIFRFRDFMIQSPPCLFLSA